MAVHIIRDPKFTPSTGDMQASVYDTGNQARDVYEKAVTKYTVDTDLSSGLVSGTVYIGAVPNETEIVFTIPNWDVSDEGKKVTFLKQSGTNSALRIRSVDTSFDEVLIDNETSISLLVGTDQYSVIQDSRVQASDISISFYPTDSASVIKPTGSLLLNSNPPAGTLVSGSITSFDSGTPTSLGFFYNDAGILDKTIAETLVTSIAVVKKTLTANRDFKFKFKYYEYEISTNTTTFLSETSYSEWVTDHLVYSDKIVTGNLPTHTWDSTDKILAIELLAYKSASAGDVPTATFFTGGSTPSLARINLPYGNVAGLNTGQEVGIAGETVASGESAYMSTVNGKYYLANATDNTKVGHCVIIVTAGGLDDEIIVQREGVANVSGLTPFADHYLDIGATDGVLTTTVPSASGNQIVYYGRALSSNRLRLHITSASEIITLA
jgi:hypothetical protein